MAKAKAKKETKRSKKPRKGAVDPNTLLGQLVELTKPVKVTQNRSQRTLPAWTIGRVERVHHGETLHLTDPLTGDLFAKSVPVKYVQLMTEGLSPSQLGDASLVRMNKAELENEVIRLRTQVRRLQAMDMGDPRMVELFSCLPEYGVTPDTAVPLSATEEQDATTGSLEDFGGDDARGDVPPDVDDSDQSGVDSADAAACAAAGDPDAEPEGFGRDGDDDVDPDAAIEVAVAGAIDGGVNYVPDESGEQPNSALTDDRADFDKPDGGEQL